MTFSFHRLKAWLVRFTALAALLTAAPGASEIVRDALAVVFDGACCGDEACGADSDEACSESCVHCGSIVSTVAVSPSLVGITQPESIAIGTVVEVQDGSARGYRKPQLRPATS